MTRLTWTLLLLALLSADAFGQTEPAGGAKPAAPGGPVSVGILVDNSGSYRSILDKVISATSAVIDDLHPEDEGYLITFVDTGKIKLRQELTQDKRELRDAAENMFIEGGPTALLDAVVYASKYAGKNAGDGRSKVLILITDGDDRENAANIEDAVRAAKTAGIRILVLGLHEEKFYAKTVDRLIRETDGAKFVPKLPKEIPAAVEKLLAAIRGR